jgi:hypothetical protein
MQPDSSIAAATHMTITVANDLLRSLLIFISSYFVFKAGCLMQPSPCNYSMCDFAGEKTLLQPIMTQFAAAFR